MTFKDEDVKNLKTFLEFIRDNAKFKLDMEESLMLTRLVGFMQLHIKNVNAHVMELIKMTTPPPEDKAE